MAHEIENSAEVEKKIDLDLSDESVQGEDVINEFLSLNKKARVTAESEWPEIVSYENPEVLSKGNIR